MQIQKAGFIKPLLNFQMIPFKTSMPFQISSFYKKGSHLFTYYAHSFIDESNSV